MSVSTFKKRLNIDNILSIVDSRLTSPLGKGFSGSIKTARLNLVEPDGISRTKSRAIKVISLSGNGKSQQRLTEEMYREASFYEAIPAHPNIIRYYGTCITIQDVYIIMEKADNDLFNILKCQTPTLSKSKEEFPNNFWINACLDAAKGIEHMHANGYYHRDIHLQNFLFFLNDSSQEPVTKVSDFGGTLHKNDAPIGFCGHRKFCSPQVVKQRMDQKPINYTFEDDVYMFGMTLFEVIQLYNEKRIFPEASESQAMQKIADGERPTFPANRAINPEFKKLIEACWSENPAKRPTMSEVVKTLQSIKDDRMVPKQLPTQVPKYTSDGNDHTIHLYMADEVMSMLQKSIRRGLVDDAMYWSAELERSGKGKSAMERISVICSEDVSLGVVSLPAYLRDQHKKYVTMWKDEHKKWEARKILLESAAVTASVIKCQVANHACGASLKYVQESLEKKSPIYHHLTRADDSWIQDLQKLMDKARANFDLETEKRVLYVLQKLYMEGFEEKTWKMVASLQTKNPETKAAIDALHDLTIPRHIGGTSGSRLRLFHSVLLYVREPFLDFSQKIPDVKVTKDIVHKFFSKDGLEGRNPEGIPDYAVDRHNKRGKGGFIEDIYHYGMTTNGYLKTAAESWKVDLSTWTPAEIEKSHGPGRRFFRDRQCGFPTLLSQFFDEGDLLDRETFAMPSTYDHDPFFFDAKEFYLFWEENYGSTEAKSEKMMQEHLKMVDHVIATLQRENPNGLKKYDSGANENKESGSKPALKQEEFPSLDEKEQKKKKGMNQPKGLKFEYRKK